MQIFDTIKKAARDGSFRLVGFWIGDLIEQKNREYGDSIPRASACLTILYPDGIQPEQYREAVAVSRCLEKLSRISCGNQGDEDAWLDLAGYGIMMLTNRRPR